MLALRLGGTVAELKRRMAYREFVAWRAFHARSPLDDSRTADLPAARIADAVMRAAGNKKSTIRSHMPDFKPRLRLVKGKPGQLSDNELAFLHRRRAAPDSD